MMCLFFDQHFRVRLNFGHKFLLPEVKQMKMVAFELARCLHLTRRVFSIQDCPLNG